ncbi:MAG: hypothetical protein J6Y38_07060 [Bacteroidaceae bacterium]|nr:hypothetical protein [Bacteroidaceae bacterium]
MKKLLLLGLILLSMGVISVKAERLHFTFSCAEYCHASWDAGTRTFVWGIDCKAEWAAGQTSWVFTAVNNLPESKDISGYTQLVITLSDFENASTAQVRIQDQDGNGSPGSGDYAYIDLYAGTNVIDLKTIEKGKCDFNKIEDITIYGGERTNASASASVKIVEAYFVGPDAPFVLTKGGFGEEITSLEDVTDGTKFAIGDGTNAMYWISSSVDNQKSNVKSVPNDCYYYYKLEKVEGLDTDNDGNAESDNYRIEIVNASGEAAVVGWNFGPYLNYSKWGHLFAATARAKEGNDTYNYGWDGDYYGIWKVAYSEGNGFTLKNAGINKYAKVIGSSDEVTYLKFYKSIDFTSTTLYPANDDIFALSKATGYDAETGEMTNGTWTFDTPVDLSNWKYIIIAMEDGCANEARTIAIKDKNEVTVAGNQYDGTVAGTGPQMYFSRWNHQNIGCISLDYLLKNGMDIENIKSLSISGTTKPFVVYLSSYDNTNLLSTYRYFLYKEGDDVRNYAKADVGKFGTICLPYKASVAGAEVYSIASGDENGITLTKVNGLLEAGKPYFYKASDNIGQDNHDGDPEKNVHNVNFFRADFDRYDAATPGYNNGLIGTFSEITAPAGENYWILSSNKLYDTEGCTGADAVTIGANKAYIDTTKITSKAAGSRTILLSFDGAEEKDPTAIESTEAVEVLTEGVFYDMSGREVKNPTTGIYIVKYGNVTKKVMIK